MCRSYTSTNVTQNKLIDTMEVKLPDTKIWEVCLKKSVIISKDKVYEQRLAQH